MQTVIERLVEARLIVKEQDSIEPAHDALVRAWKTLHEWIHAVGRDALILWQRMGPDADHTRRPATRQLLWSKNPNLAVAARALKDPQHAFNAKEAVFIRKSVARNRRKKQVAWAIAFTTVVSLMALSVWALLERATAEEEKERALAQPVRRLEPQYERGAAGQPVRAWALRQGAARRWARSVAVARAAPGRHWKRSMGQPTSRVFAASRKFGWGSVIVYAQDGLTLDDEITDDSDNLLFAQNALAWLTPLELKAGCAKEITILAWDGTFAKLARMERVREFIERRGWVLQMARPETLETDLACAEVLWYLSDWEPPAEFADWHVQLIEDFVQSGGGLLVGGLGWSYAQQGGPGGTAAPAPYAADLLGKPFGFAFTRDAFQSDGGTADHAGARAVRSTWKPGGNDEWIPDPLSENHGPCWPTPSLMTKAPEIPSTPRPRRSSSRSATPPISGR